MPLRINTQYLKRLLILDWSEVAEPSVSLAKNFRARQIQGELYRTMHINV